MSDVETTALWTAPPSEVDAQWATLSKNLNRTRSVVKIATDDLHRFVGDRRDPTAAKLTWIMPDGDVLEAIRRLGDHADPSSPRAREAGRLHDKLQQLTAQEDNLHDRLTALSTIYRRRGGWSRAYLAMSRNGHLHRDRTCGTLRPTTRLAWLTEYSGLSESLIVEIAGWRACSVCFPSAPRGDGDALPGSLDLPAIYAAARASR